MVGHGRCGDGARHIDSKMLGEISFRVSSYLLMRLSHSAEAGLALTMLVYNKQQLQVKTLSSSSFMVVLRFLVHSSGDISSTYFLITTFPQFRYMRFWNRPTA